MPNRLACEQSPYLLQHKDNPVDWYPWSEEAFERAKSEQKPVFLSIGYATCHWCHVMEHESFEDPDIARLMNEAFINIKVDREERPDLDQMYMTVCQMLTGQGGWPLTIIMTPDKEPFFAATYIPKEARFNRVGLRQLIPGIRGVWENEPTKISKAVEKIKEGFHRSLSFEAGDFPGTVAIDYATEQLLKDFDKDFGGFGNAPKFPTPHNLIFLLRQWHHSRDERLISAVTKTLESMRLGGIWDHVGYGFHRYSTDREWLLPHFEKMLYDQALLMIAYTEAWLATKNTLFKQTVYQIAEYVTRDLQHKEGFFYSAEDADSEGEEGKFYTWSTNELERILDGDEFYFLTERFNLEKEGNFTDEATGQLTGQNILWLGSNLADEEYSKWDSIRIKLMESRTKRERPLLDDKLLTDWNALMISALSRAGTAFDDHSLTKTAEKAYTFLKSHMLDDQTLWHRYRDGNIAIPGFADDYAFLISAGLDLYEATFNSNYLRDALDVQDLMDEQFWDSENGGYFFSSTDTDLVLGRQKPIYDGAIPSANSTTMLNLIKLSRLTSDTSYEEKAQLIGKYFSAELIRSGSGITMGMMALQFIYQDAQEYILAEGMDTEVFSSMLREIQHTYLPQKVMLMRPLDQNDEIFSLSEFIQSNEPINNTATLYICRNYACDTPVNDLVSLKKQLAKK